MRLEAGSEGIDWIRRVVAAWLRERGVVEVAGRLLRGESLGPVELRAVDLACGELGLEEEFDWVVYGAEG